MTLTVPVNHLARALGAETVRSGDGAVRLPIGCAAWLGRDAGQPLRLEPAATDSDDSPACWLLRSDQAVPADTNTPVLATGRDTDDLRYRADHFLDGYLPLVVSGTLVGIQGTGVLLRGAAGVGKSQAALGLLDRGHQLIADDAVSLRCGTQRRLEGHTPETTGGFVFLRGLGPLAVEDHYPCQRQACHRIDLIVSLDVSAPADPLNGAWGQSGLMGRPLPSLRVSSERPVPLIVELAAREIRRNGRPLTGIQYLPKQRKAHRL